LVKIDSQSIHKFYTIKSILNAILLYGKSGIIFKMLCRAHNKKGDLFFYKSP
jgi:hypothetical protein